jgi:hypothetical protein
MSGFQMYEPITPLLNKCEAGVTLLSTIDAFNFAYMDNANRPALAGQIFCHPPKGHA